MSDLTRGERLQIMLTEEELSAVDDWRFKKRMPSRAAAVRELLRRGLAADGFLLADGGQKSEDFGVTNGSARDKRTIRASAGKSYLKLEWCDREHHRAFVNTLPFATGIRR